MKEEFWTKRDGTRIAVGDMDVDHLRNRRILVSTKHDEMSGIDFHEDDGRAMLNAQAHRDLANLNVFFPLIGGGVYGSPALQKRYE